MKLEFNEQFKLPNGWECNRYSVVVDDGIDIYDYSFFKNTRTEEGFWHNRHLSVRGCTEGHFQVTFQYRRENNAAEDRVESAGIGPLETEVVSHDGSVGSIKIACIANASVFFAHGVKAILAKINQGLEVSK